MEDIAKRILNMLCERSELIKRRIRHGEMAVKLSGLHSGEDIRELTYTYYAGKIKNLILLIVASVILLIVTAISQHVSHTILEGNKISRTEVGKMDTVTSLNAVTEDYDYGDIEITVSSRHYSKQETYRLMDELEAKLRERMKGENESLDRIEHDMDLVGESKMYPFIIRWESSNYPLLNDDGKLADNYEYEEVPVDVTLKLTLIYEEYEKQYTYDLQVYPKKLSESEDMTERINAAIETADSDTVEDSYLILPSSIDGKNITWTDVKEPVVLLLGIVSVILIFAVWIGQDNDVDRCFKKRNEELAMQYSEFVSKLCLLISSGMTIRGALEKMAADYTRNEKSVGHKKYVYEELITAINKLNSGMSEYECYEFFGRRCGLLPYKKLTSLLTQNLKKGTDGLTIALKNEMKLAFEERKSLCRKKGEEAQTKLIIPMIIMLSVVMIIIMIPAYLSFGGV